MTSEPHPRETGNSNVAKAFSRKNITELCTGWRVTKNNDQMRMMMKKSISGNTKHHIFYDKQMESTTKESLELRFLR